MTLPAPRSGWRRHRVAGGVGGAILLALIVFIALFQWNWLRGPLAHAISARLNRPVTITGNLEVHPWSWSPRATINGLVIGNPAWAGPAPMARLPRLTVQVKLLPLLKGQVRLPLVEADRPDVTLLRDASGRANWVWRPGQKPKPLKLPAINHLIIADGAVRFDDAQRRLHFTGVISSNESVIGAGRGVFRLEGKGTLNQARFVALVTGGPLINVDPSRAYPFEARIEAGATRVSARGRIDHPFDLAGVSGVMSVSGPDFSDLYHLTGLALPSTPPYALSAGFSRVNANYAFRRIHGRMGDSDLSGDLAIDDDTGRPFLTGGLASRRLNLPDLLAVTGGGARHVAGRTVSPSQKVMAARLAAEHRLLPDARLDVSRIRGMDARLAYRAASVAGAKLPIRALSFDLALDHGVLSIDPLSVNLPQGRLAGSIRLDARRATPVTGLDLRLTNARLETLVAARGGASPIEGGLYARVKLTGAGDSVRAAAAHANGQLTVIVPGGRVRTAFAELLGIDVTKGLFLLITKNKGETPIRCAVADFKATDGVLNAQSIVFDSDVVLAKGDGRIDLRDETLDLTLSGKPKKFRLVRIGAPITLRGTLEAPKVGVDVVKAAPQAAMAVALGAVVAPLAAVLPLLGPGLAKDADCGALTAQAAARGAPVARGRR